MRFLVQKVEHRPESRELSLTGTISEGVLVTGMRAELDGGASPFVGSILEIEYVPTPEDANGTRLTVIYGTELSPDALHTDDWVGRELTLDM